MDVQKVRRYRFPPHKGPGPGLLRVGLQAQSYKLFAKLQNFYDKFGIFAMKWLWVLMDGSWLLPAVRRLGSLRSMGYALEGVQVRT